MTAPRQQREDVPRGRMARPVGGFGPYTVSSRLLIECNAGARRNLAVRDRTDPGAFLRIRHETRSPHTAVDGER